MQDIGSIPKVGARTGRPPAGRGAGGVRRLRTVAIAAVAAASLVATAACDTADAANEPSPPQQGGTLHVMLGAGMPEYLDPGRVQTATEANISRLFTRTLTAFKAEPGAAASEIVGDLATDTGRPSDGNRVWTFRLKEGVRWQDGSLVSCAQVKYGVERSFSKIFETAQSYPKAFLEGGDTYAGPFGGESLNAIECVDTRTVRFRLKRPVGDFGYTVAMTVFAPVPESANHDLKAPDNYNVKPWSTGPYMVESHSKDEMVLVRNPHWNKATDPVRRQYAEKIVIRSNEDAARVTNALIQDQGESRSTVMLDVDVSSTFVQQVVNDPVLNARTIQGPTGATRYFAINTLTVPDIHCRKALAYGFNKRKYRSARGGSMFGDLATGMIPPNLRAYKKFDHYGTKTNPDGQPDKAREEMAAAGGDCFAGNVLKIAYRDTPQIKRYVSTIADTFARQLGLQVKLTPLEASAYYTTISDSANPYHMLYAGWVPDWANGSAVIPPLFDGRNVKKSGELGSTNFSGLKNAEIDKLIDEAYAESDLDRQYLLWGELDDKLQDMAVTIPVMYENALRLAGSNVRGGFIHPQFASPDLVALGLADPALSPA